MDPRLLEYYNRELQFVRETGAEFAQAYPRIAARLGIEGLQCADPYVERLLESFAFLTARVQLKLDARHPDFTQHLLELVYPHVLCPVPSCAIVEFVPDLSGGLPPTGQVVPKGTSLRTPLNKGDRTVCEFRTAHEVTLWPLEVTEARYLVGSSVLSSQGLSHNGLARSGPIRGALRLRLKAAPGIELKSLRPEQLTFFIKATSTVAALLYEQIAADCTGFHARSAHSGAAVHVRDAKCVRTIGLEDDEALLPVTRSGFQGYRLLQEYFALPERLLFFTLQDLGGIFAQAEGDELEIYLGLARTHPALENAVAAEHLRLGCTPAINLFSRAADRIHMNVVDTEMHLVPDRNRPLDFEVFSIDRVQAIGANSQRIADVQRFYSGHHLVEPGAAKMYYTLQRQPRKISSRQREIGTRSAYVGSECFLSIVDSAQRHFRGEIQQLEVQTTCTNRDLPILLAAGQGPTDFHVEGGGPIESVRCIVGTTFPRPAAAFGDTAWKLISQLTLNYLSLVEHSPQGGPQMLSDLLALYTDPNDPAHTRQVEGVRGVSYRPVVRRVPMPGPMSYGRGLEISLTLDDAAFEGMGIVPLASVLEQFFARYVSLNSFTQTRVRSASRGEIKTWPVRLGRRSLV
jgi:type VI secretion system protein ImpG